MARIAMLGGGVCGLAAGMMLARAGHEVTVLERDPAPVPDSPEAAWEGWSREGVVQFRQAHYLQPAGRMVLEEMLPDVVEALARAGATPFDPMQMLPPALLGEGPQPGDERFRTLTARRPVLEHVLGRAAEDQPGLQVRRGAAASELIVESRDGVPHVSGVRLGSGEALMAELVIDAMGRRSQLPRLLADAGVGPIEEQAEDSGFVYYTRFFKARPGGSAPTPMGPLLMPVGSFTILTLPGDNDTWSVTLYISRGDQPLKALRHAERWMALAAACPLHAHWLEGEPITDVMPMAGVVDRRRRLAVDGRPLLSGVVLLGDAWACTNPSLGRGMSLGLMHARHLPGVVEDHIESPLELAQAWEALTEAEMMPWYEETVAEDRDRLREIEAIRNGQAPPRPDELAPASALRMAMFGAMTQDGEIFRAFLESRACLTPLGRTFARPGMAERIVGLASGMEPPPLAGPDRETLLQMMA